MKYLRRVLHKLELIMKSTTSARFKASTLGGCMSLGTSKS